MTKSHIIRGYGPLDSFIAKKRYKMVDKQIQISQKSGRILDIGCGSYPLFLLSACFEEKYGLDKMVNTETSKAVQKHNIKLVKHEFDKEHTLPLENNYFDTVSMLAVFEHIEPDKLIRIHQEIHRVLKPQGLYVMTTPAFWTDRLLRLLAKLRLISEEEINDHKGSYNRSDIFSVLQSGGFERSKLRFGHFEMFMNSWATAVK